MVTGAGLELNIEVFGEVELSRQILRFTQVAEDMRPAFNDIHTDFLDVERRQFEGQGIGPSGKWAPLADSTKEAKARAGLDPRILIATERLFKSLTDESDADHVYFTTADSMRIGSAVGYGKFHQSREARSRLPRRPPVDLKESTKKKWVKYIQGWLVESFRNARHS
jgi:phage gpG-like protein